MLISVYVTHAECKKRGSDVIFVLDASGSIKDYNFERMKAFVVNVTNQFTIGPQHTRVGVIVFSTNAKVAFSLDTYDTADGVISHTEGIEYSGGWTDTASALNLLVSELSNGRLEVPRIAIVLTDGKSTNKTATVLATQNVHENNINAYAVGIGDGINQKELEEIAGSTGNVKNIEGFDITELQSLQSDLNLAACHGIHTYKHL